MVLFYKYVRIVEPPAFVAFLKDTCTGLGLTGRVLVAEEGINGTLAGTSPSAIDRYISALTACTLGDFSGMDFKRSTAPSQPFPSLLLKIVPELISTGGRIAAPLEGSGVVGGVHLAPADFHRQMLESDPEKTVIIDVRCSKEVAIGHFDHAVDPDMRTFIEFPKFVREHKEEMRGKKVLMYCTGGIRCEKASAFMKAEGYDEVYQLKGGIHRYLEAFPDGGLFRGSNFVFDKRVSMDPGCGSHSVVGSCIDCHEPFDTLSGDIICTVCRELVLVCPSCRAKAQGAYYCKTHFNLKGAYYYFLNHFTVEELGAQLHALRTIHGSLVGDRGLKSRRSTLWKQMRRVEARISDLVSGAATPEPYTPRCRTCSSTACAGRCWGFWAENKEPAATVEIGARRPVTAADVIALHPGGGLDEE